MSKGKSKPEAGILIIAQNKKAWHEYEIQQRVEAGVALRGSEVKSVRAGGISLRESYVGVIGSELYLVGAHITPYSHAPAEAHEPTANRKLLLHRREIDRLIGLVSQKGLTLLAMKVYFKGGRCKLEVGVGRGKKLHDKRESSKERDVERRLKRAMNVRDRE